MQVFLFLAPLLHFLLTISLVLFLYRLSIGPEPLAWLNQKLYAVLELDWGGYYVAGVAAVLILLEIEYIILKMRLKKESRYITFDHPKGKVALSVRAIEDFIKKISKGFPEIKEISPKVRDFRREIKVVLSASLWSGYNLANVADEVQKNIKSQIQNILGIEKALDVEINIVEVIEKKIEPFQDKILQGFGSQ